MCRLRKTPVSHCQSVNPDPTIVDTKIVCWEIDCAAIIDNLGNRRLHDHCLGCNLLLSRCQLVIQLEYHNFFSSGRPD